MMVVDRAVVPTSETARRGLVPDLDLLVSFFGELQVCVNTMSCDDKTAKAHLLSYAQSLYCLHEPYILWRNTTYNGYGSGLRDFGGLTNSRCSE